jgi:phosphoribosylformylglycinamidine synthase
MGLIRLYRTPALSPDRRLALLARARQHVDPTISDLASEYCFYVDATTALDASALEVLAWLLRETFEPAQFGRESFLGPEPGVLEVGPRMTFTTAWSTNAVSVCHACGLEGIQRIERSRRYRLDGAELSSDQQQAFLATVHDRMTECPYPAPLKTFATGIAPEPTVTVPVLAEGRAALERINREMGLAFDEWDLDYYTDLFLNKQQRHRVSG